MSKQTGRKNIFEILATFIVDKRSLMFFIYIVAVIFCCFSTFWVKVNNDLTSFLPEGTETRLGIEIMNDELATFGSARVMITNTTYDLAEDLAAQIGEIDGVAMVTFDATESHFKGTEALLDVTFAGATADPVSENAMEEIKALLAPYDIYIDSDVGYDMEAMLNSEIAVITVMAVIIVVTVLLLTSRAWMEVPVLLITFGAAAILNMGTNYWFGSISFVSNSVSMLLQLALAIDYAIILIHRFGEERETADDRTAAIRALSYSIPAIASSSLTTVCGMAAMMFMQFGIGADMGKCLVKAILFSMLSVFTLMPGLLMLFSRAIQKTRHRSLIPSIDGWGRFVYKLRHAGAVLFVLLLIGSCLLASATPYCYGYSSIRTNRRNAQQVAEDRINETFGTQNVMALVVPMGDYEKEAALMERLETYDEVSYVMGLANIEAMDGYTLADSLTPRQFSELTDLDYETASLLYTAYAALDQDIGGVVGGVDNYAIPLIDLFLFLTEQADSGLLPLEGDMADMLTELSGQLMMAYEQMVGEHYSRMVLVLNLPEESEETFDFLQVIHREAEAFYPADQVFLVGNSTSNYDLAVSFETDNVIISVLSIAFVLLILLFTFKSVGLPVLLVLVIQGSIWLNCSWPTIIDQPVFFMCYLILCAIQMGANIDYAIVISTRYQDMKEFYPPKEAMVKGLSLAFPTVLTSGTIMASASFLLGFISTEPSIVGMGQCLCRGTVISIFLVMFILPQLLVLSEKIVEKTRFNIKYPEIGHGPRRIIRVDGKIHGRVNGVVDGEIRGTIYGDLSPIGEGALNAAAEEVQTDETAE